MFEIVRSHMVGGRTDLALLCNARGLRSLAVEVGTDRGTFAADFLDNWCGEMLYCVDSYASYPEMPWNRQGDLAIAVAALAKHHRRVRFLIEESQKAAAYFGTVPGMPAEVDFVYIDAAHDASHAWADMIAWWPVVRSGGVLAGDDYDAWHPGVMEAVQQFSVENKLRVELTTDYNRAPSWFAYKP